MDVSSWSNTTSNLLPCLDGAFKVEPNVDRWSQRKDESFPTTGHAWDQISGKLLQFMKDTFRQLSNHRQVSISVPMGTIRQPTCI